MSEHIIHSDNSANTPVEQKTVDLKSVEKKPVAKFKSKWFRALSGIPKSAAQKPKQKQKQQPKQKQKSKPATPKSPAAKPEQKHKSRRNALDKALSRIPVGSSAVMIAAKGAVVAAALFSLLLLIIVGADLRPSAIVREARNKQAFLHASGEGFPVEFSSGKILQASGVKNGTAVLTSTTCTVYDRKGREVSRVNHSLPSPAMKCAGEFILLYKELGKTYLLRTVSDTCCEGELKDLILCAAISESGVFALVTNGDTNNSKLTVYSPDGKIIHKWKSVGYKICDVAVSPSGKYIALCGLSTDKGALVSTVIIQKIGVRENIKEIAVENSLIADIAFSDNASVVAVADDFAANISVGKDEQYIYGYEERQLKGYDIAGNGDIALVFSTLADGRNASVTVIDSKCREKTVINTDLTSPYVDLDGGRISLLCQSSVTRYDYKGRLLDSTEVQDDCQTIFSSCGKLLSRSLMSIDAVSR